MNVQLTVQVPRSPDLNALFHRFEQKLEPLLIAFQPDLVQVQGRLLRHTSREGVECRLNLHLPTGQLSGEKVATTAQAAFRGASEELLRQLKKHKQKLRETRPHQRSARTETSARQENRNGPSLEPGADLMGYFGEHYADVLGFVQRQVALRERLGELEPGQIDAHEVLDEVVVAALDSRTRELRDHRARWLLVLAAAAIGRLVKQYGSSPQGQPLEPIENNTLIAEEADPEELANTDEWMRRLAHAVRRLPAAQRQDVVLYLLEGFRVEELAEMSQRSTSEVEASITAAEATLRKIPDLPQALLQTLRQAPELGAATRRRSAALRMEPQRA